MMEEGYIVVYQDVRGRWMSDGLYDNMRAIFLIKNQNMLMKLQIRMILLIGWLKIDHNNGNVGIWNFIPRVLCYLFLIK
jgi:hypothetical protein